MTVNIFKCTGNETEIIPGDMLKKLNISYEDANKDASKMVLLSKSLKEYGDKKYCTIPFCHTVEAEGLGSAIILDQKVGNRVSKYAISDLNSIENIKLIDLNDGRISEVLKAIKLLKDDGEKVCINITGPISLATSTMDSRLFYRTIRKNRGIIDNLLKTIEDSIVGYILEAIAQGADIISFADPTGTIDIVGPRIYNEISGTSVYNILKRIEERLGSSVVHLCGKTSTSLEAIGILESKKMKIEGDSYGDMIENIRKERDDIRFIGHWCLKLNKRNNEITICEIK